MKKTKSRYLLCKEKTCFAYDERGGVCTILTNTQFKRKCPFYKPKDAESVKVSK